MLALSALFTDVEQVTIVDRQKAELYMQIYQYAAEDFLTVADANVYAVQMTEYFVSVETQLARILAMIAKHTHMGAHGSTSPPLNGPEFVWQFLKKPVLLFTPLKQIGMITGVQTVPNLFNNFVIPGTSMEGSMSFGARRAMPILLLTAPTIPPLIMSTLKGAII